MKTAFRESFEADLSAITDAALLRRIRRIIEQVERARTFLEISNLKRLQATGKYYRIRVGDYRIGFALEASTVTFVRCLNRKEYAVSSPDYQATGSIGTGLLVMV